MSIYLITKQLNISDFEEDIKYENSLEFVKNWLSNRKLENNRLIACDTETSGFDPHTCKLLTLQLGDFDNQLVINCNEFDISELKEYLEDNFFTYIFHNAKFDLKFLLANNIYLKNIIDTYLTDKVIYGGYTNEDGIYFGLDSVSKRYLNLEIDKSIRGNIHKQGLSEQVIRYCADDVKYLEQIYKKQEELIQHYNLQEVLYLEFKVCRVFAKMEFTGISFNSVKWLDVAKIVKTEKDEIVKKLDNELLNYKSNQKLHKYFNNQIGLGFFEERTILTNWSSHAQKIDILKKIGLKIDSVSDANLQKNKNNSTIVKYLIDYSKFDKLASSFGESFINFINPVTGKLHFNINQILTTGRIAYNEPNLAQIPSKGELSETIRACFIPREGYKITGGDFSGFELRIIAEFSKDKLWIDSFNNGDDLHSVLCSKTFGIPIENVKSKTDFKPDIDYRTVQKTINFMLAYGGSEHKLSDVMQIPIKKAKEIIDKFFKEVPGVYNFLNNLGTFAKNNGYTKSAAPFNRIRWFPKWKDAVNNNNFKILGEIERAGKNTPIQSTNADIIKLALINVQKFIDDNDYPANILLAIYDEIQCECREDKALEFKGILENIMIESAKVCIKSIPVVVDCKVNAYWAK